MTKKCPECGNSVPDEAHFCGECGHDFLRDTGSSSTGGLFSSGKIFLVLIGVVIVIGAVLMIGMAGDDGSGSVDTSDVEHIDMTITDVLGYSGSSSYTLYTEAIFNSVPDNLDGYNIKTIYYDSDDKQIGQETETASNIYYDTDYSISFGHYTTYKLPDPDHVEVQVIKNGEVIDTFTEKIDTSKIHYLNQGD